MTANSRADPGTDAYQRATLAFVLGLTPDYAIGVWVGTKIM